MQAITIEGALHAVFSPKKVNDRLTVAEFVVLAREQQGGAIHLNPIKLKAFNGLCDIIEKIEIGTQVKVDFNIVGNEHVDKSTGNVMYYVDLRAFRVVTIAQTAPQYPIPPEGNKMPQFPPPDGE